MTTLQPTIAIETGFKIGYSSALATLEQSVELCGGTHFLLARNGRGKTTLLRTLARTLRQVAGNFSTSGFIQYLPEDMRFDPDISARWLFQTLLSKPKRDEAFALADRIELDVKKPYGRLSTGNRRKTSLILAEYSVRPSSGNILLLDEPFSGLDVFARQAFEEIWRNSPADVLRLVSCHPDYDAMEMPSALLIENGMIRHVAATGQNWNTLKSFLN